MSLNDHLNDIVGKTISRVITVENEFSPAKQVFLVFDDDTSFELYGNINNAKGLDGVKFIDCYKSDSTLSVRKEYSGKVVPNEATKQTDTNDIANLTGKFDLGGMSGGNIFDDALYGKIKPHLNKAWEAAKKGGKENNETLGKFIRDCVASMGEQIKPYIKKYYCEVRNISLAK